MTPADLVTEYLPLALWAIRRPHLVGIVARIGYDRAYDTAIDSLLRTAAQWDGRCDVGAFLVRRVQWDLATALRDHAIRRRREPARVPLDCDTPDRRTLGEPRHLIDVEAAVRRLPPRLREVIERRYYGERLQREIATDTGTTQSRVCQLEAQALKRLREML